VFAPGVAPLNDAWCNGCATNFKGIGVPRARKVGIADDNNRRRRCLARHCETHRTMSDLDSPLAEREEVCLSVDF